MFRLRNIIIGAGILVLAAAVVGYLLFSGDFNPIGRTALVVQTPSANYGFDPNHNFLGGKNSWISIKVAYPKKGSLDNISQDVLNTVSDSSKATKGWVYETLRVPAFKVDNPREEMCRDQFNALYQRLKGAKVVMIELEQKGEKNYTEAKRITNVGSREVKVYPSRLVILYDEEDIKNINK
jgi:hypothetical protein